MSNFYKPEDTLHLLSSKKAPHECPICNGKKVNYSHDAIMRGKDAIGYYGKYKNCLVCDGKGIVWG